MVNFEDILYTPLDVPDLPEFDTQKLVHWIKENHTKYKFVNEYIAQNNYSSEKDIENYPWDLTPIYLNMYGERTGWIEDFDKLFPQVCKHIECSYGLTLDDIGSVYSLPMKDEYSGWGFWHRDYDPSGVRFYFEFESYDTEALFIEKEGSGNKQSCKVKSNKQSFYLNNVDAMHATYTPPEAVGKVRIAAFITPRFDNTFEFMEKTRNLILKSAEKYKDTYARFA